MSLRIWQPIIIHGLLQTAEYARALFLGAQSDLSDDALEPMVAARTGRQVILDRPEPPNLLVVLDEAVLHRLVGSPKIMHEQLIHLAAVSSRSHVSVQVIPAAVGAHAGLGGSFTIAAVDGKPDAMHVDSVEGITVEKSTVEKSTVVRKAGIAFDHVRGDALPRWASRDLILKVAEERWNAWTALAGVRPAAVPGTAASASRSRSATTWPSATPRIARAHCSGSARPPGGGSPRLACSV